MNRIFSFLYFYRNKGNLLKKTTDGDQRNHTVLNCSMKIVHANDTRILLAAPLFI